MFDYNLSADGLVRLMDAYRDRPEVMEELDNLVYEFRTNIEAYAEEYVNGAFEPTFDQAITMLDQPGWGFPADVQKLVDEFNRELKQLLD
jgi:hypothetical protein